MCLSMFFDGAHVEYDMNSSKNASLKILGRYGECDFGCCYGHLRVLILGYHINRIICYVKIIR